MYVITVMIKSDNHRQSHNHNNQSSDLRFSQTSGIMVGNKPMRTQLII